MIARAKQEAKEALVKVEDLGRLGVGAAWALDGPRRVRGAMGFLVGPPVHRPQ